MDALIINALNMVNLNVTPETYIKDLSGGMKQKLAIVETILQQSKTFVLDETDSNVRCSSNGRFMD